MWIYKRTCPFWASGGTGGWAGQRTWISTGDGKLEKR